MNAREKVMAAIVGVLAVGALGYASVKKLYFDRDKEYDATRVKLKQQLADLRRQNAKVSGAANSIEGWASLTYDTDELRASAKIGASLVALVERAGLNAEKLSLQPTRGAYVRGAYREIGRTIRVRGKLQNIVDFLYLLEQEPHLHRLDNLSISPEPKTNEIDLQVRYITILIESTKGVKTDELPTTAPTDLESDQRNMLNCIASRDLFRPYIQKLQVAITPPPRPTPTPRTSPRPTPTPRPAPKPSGPPPNPSRFKIVGLPEWGEKHEVLVSDGTTGQLRKYHLGDTLGGGTIVMVDYRSLPSPANPQLRSPSRVILKMDPDFWAIELGQTLTEKRRMKRDQLPEKMPDLPDTAPGDSVKKNNPAER